MGIDQVGFSCFIFTSVLLCWRFTAYRIKNRRWSLRSLNKEVAHSWEACVCVCVCVSVGELVHLAGSVHCQLGTIQHLCPSGTSLSQDQYSWGPHSPSRSFPLSIFPTFISVLHFLSPPSLLLWMPPLFYSHYLSHHMNLSAYSGPQTLFGQKKKYLLKYYFRMFFVRRKTKRKWLWLNGLIRLLAEKAWFLPWRLCNTVQKCWKKVLNNKLVSDVLHKCNKMARTNDVI